MCRIIDTHALFVLSTFNQNNERVCDSGMVIIRVFRPAAGASTLPIT